MVLMTVVEEESCPTRLCYPPRSEEHTSELQSQSNLVCRLLLEKKKWLEETPHRARIQVRRAIPSLAPRLRTMSRLRPRLKAHDPTRTAQHSQNSATLSSSLPR